MTLQTLPGQSFREATHDSIFAFMSGNFVFGWMFGGVGTKTACPHTAAEPATRAVARQHNRPSFPICYPLCLVIEMTVDNTERTSTHLVFPSNADDSVFIPDETDARYTERECWSLLIGIGSYLVNPYVATES